MKRLIRPSMVLVFSTLFSWIGAAMDHGDWFGWASNILGVVGIFVGIWVGRIIVDYVEG